MNKKEHKLYYLNNKKYTKFLETQTIKDFQKYIDFVKEYFKKDGKFLDIGCGTGIALNAIKGNGKAVGLEISDLSVKECLKKGLRCKQYDGNNFPFKDSGFSVVGSFNVLEHVDDVELYLRENLRVLNKGGYLLIACPNFLSVTNSFHYHTRGAFQKYKNMLSIIKKFITKSSEIEKMEAVVRKKFMPDDDAVNITNPISLLFWGKKNGLKLEHWSSQSVYRDDVIKYLDKTFLKIFLGSNFMVFKKL